MIAKEVVVYMDGGKPLGMDASVKLNVAIPPVGQRYPSFCDCPTCALRCSSNEIRREEDLRNWEKEEQSRSGASRKVRVLNVAGEAFEIGLRSYSYLGLHFMSDSLRHDSLRPRRSDVPRRVDPFGPSFGDKGYPIVFLLSEIAWAVLDRDKVLPPIDLIALLVKKTGQDEEEVGYAVEPEADMDAAEYYRYILRSKTDFREWAKYNGPVSRGLAVGRMHMDQMREFCFLNGIPKLIPCCPLLAVDPRRAPFVLELLNASGHIIIGTYNHPGKSGPSLQSWTLWPEELEALDTIAIGNIGDYYCRGWASQPEELPKPLGYKLVRDCFSSSILPFKAKSSVVPLLCMQEDCRALKLEVLDKAKESYRSLRSPRPLDRKLVDIIEAIDDEVRYHQKISGLINRRYPGLQKQAYQTSEYWPLIAGELVEPDEAVARYCKALFPMGSSAPCPRIGSSLRRREYNIPDTSIDAYIYTTDLFALLVYAVHSEDGIPFLRAPSLRPGKLGGIVTDERPGDKKSSRPGEIQGAHQVWDRPFLTLFRVCQDFLAFAREEVGVEDLPEIVADLRYPEVAPVFFAWRDLAVEENEIDMIFPGYEVNGELEWKMDVAFGEVKVGLVGIQNNRIRKILRKKLTKEDLKEIATVAKAEVCCDDSSKAEIISSIMDAIHYANADRNWPFR